MNDFGDLRVVIFLIISLQSTPSTCQAIRCGDDTPQCYSISGTANFKPVNRLPLTHLFLFVLI